MKAFLVFIPDDKNKNKVETTKHGEYKKERKFHLASASRPVLGFFCLGFMPSFEQLPGTYMVRF